LLHDKMKDKEKRERIIDDISSTFNILFLLMMYIRFGSCEH